MLARPIYLISMRNHGDKIEIPQFYPRSAITMDWLLHFFKCLQMNPLLYACFWLAGTRTEHCQSQNVNKTLIGCWPVRIGLSGREKKAITGPAVSRRPRLDDERGIRRNGFKAPQRRTPIGPEAIWVKRESKGILQRGANYVLDI